MRRAVGRTDTGDMGRVLWSVREGEAGQFDAPEIMAGFRAVDHEPRPGDLLVLPDGSGPWRVVDRAIAAQTESAGNVLVVQLFGPP
jgi:hypothetical protein